MADMICPYNGFKRCDWENCAARMWINDKKTQDILCEYVLSPIMAVLLQFLQRTVITMAKEYIERDALIENLNKFAPGEYSRAVDLIIEKQPAADVVEVVRCRDCEYGEWDESEQLYKCNYAEDDLIPTYEEADFYCARGKRRDDNAAD